jgi:hypothetical protein
LLYIHDIGFFLVLLPFRVALKNKTIQFIPLQWLKVRAMFNSLTTLDLEEKKSKPRIPASGCGGKEWVLSDRGCQFICSSIIFRSSKEYFKGYRASMLKA